MKTNGVRLTMVLDSNTIRRTVENQVNPGQNKEYLQSIFIETILKNPEKVLSCVLYLIYVSNKFYSLVER